MKKLFVLFAAVALVAAFALPAAAATPTLEEHVADYDGHVATHWNFYGSARVSTWYEGLTDEIRDIDTDNFNLALQGNSRIGSRVDLGNGISGRFEYGTGVNVRILWGEWDFGGGSFGVGQHYTPIDMFYSNQVWGSDNDLLNFGGVYSGRRPMLRLKMAGFQVALLQAEKPDYGTGFSTEAPLPAIEAAYSFNAGPVAMKVAGMAQQFKFAKDTPLDSNVTTWDLALGGKVDLGAAAIWGDVYYGQNLGPYMYQSGNASPVIVQTGAVSTGVEDTNTFGGILGVTFKATDMLAFELGGGYTLSTNDEFDNDDNGWSVYVNSVITLAPGFFIVPEIGYFNYDDAPFIGVDGSFDEGDLVYAGAKFQINF